MPQSTGLFGQYVLSIDVANTTPPQVTSDSLPVQGTTSSSIIDSFSLGFSEDLNPASVNDTANYLLQDSLGNTYHVTGPGYTTGTSASYQISDGPLQPGSYTLTVTGLTDPTGNTLVPYTLSFDVVNVAPFTLEGRGDNSPGTATPLATPSSQPDGSFSPGNSYSVAGAQPYFTASASLRGPGQPLDLVTANFSSNTISVLLGNGDGTFQAPVTYAVGSEPIALAIGDLTGSGIPDIVVANWNSTTISVLFGNGDGTFQAPVTYAVGSNPRGVAIADLDGTHGNDIAVANWSSDSVSVLLNNGDGTFAPAVNYAVGAQPAGLVVADLNGDGNLDIATANVNSNSVSVLPGNGDGTFGSALSYSTGSNPYDLVAVKLTAGDGRYDLATANNGDGTVSVLINQGTPGAPLTASSFAPAVNYATGANSPEHLVAADLNGDGNQDIAVAGFYSQQVEILLGNGDGTLRAASSVSSYYPFAITAGDFAGDGDTDLAVASYYGDNVTILVPNHVKALPVDPNTGLASGFGRGALLNSSTADYFSWTGTAGDVVQLASETPGNAPIHRPLLPDRERLRRHSDLLLRLRQQLRRPGPVQPDHVALHRDLPGGGLSLVRLHRRVSLPRHRGAPLRPVRHQLRRIGQQRQCPDAHQHLPRKPHRHRRRIHRPGRRQRRLLQPRRCPGRNPVQPQPLAAGRQHPRRRDQHLQLRRRQRHEQHHGRRHAQLHRPRRTGRSLLRPGQLGQHHHRLLLDGLGRRQQ